LYDLFPQNGLISAKIKISLRGATLTTQSLRSVHPAVSIIGMCNWSAWRFNKEGRKAIDDVAESIADLTLNAVQRDETRRPRGNNVCESLRVMQEELDYLKQSMPRHSAVARPGEMRRMCT
jgi:hypothetical protein